MSFYNNEEKSTRNMMIAVVAFMAVMFGYNYFFEENLSNQNVAEESPEDVSEETEEVAQTEATVSDKVSVKDAMKRSSRVSIENSNMTGYVDLNGAVIDSIVLKKYKQSVDDDSGNVMLLTPKGSESEYYYVISYDDKINGSSISENSIWSLVNQTENELVIKTKTENGLSIERTVTLDDNYVITIKDRLINGSKKNIKISKKAELFRANPVHNNYAIVHEGLVYNIKRNHKDTHYTKVSEKKYSDIEKKEILKDCKWIGFTDIYWFCSILNNYDKNSSISFSKTGDDSYKVSLYSRKDIVIPTGSAVELNYGLFTGPKDMRLLKNYAQELNLDKFEMSIDFGWFFMITKPLLQLMEILQKLFSNMGLVILVLTLLFKVITYPLMKKSFESAAKMREVQPKIAAIQKMYSYDKVRMNQEMMALYKKEKVSPMSGCLPMLLQAPIFFCLYKVFFISINMRHAPLFGWIHDLSAPDQLYIFNLFGLLDWDLPGFLQIGVWPLIMGLTMFIQQKLSSAISGQRNVEKTQEMKIQENMMLIMPIVFTYICSSFPVGVVIYWTISNIFSVIQQYYVNKKIRIR